MDKANSSFDVAVTVAVVLCPYENDKKPKKNNPDNKNDLIIVKNLFEDVKHAQQVVRNMALIYNFFANFVLMGRLFSCFQDEFIEAGCDEAGRGCLAGPVVAAAVILHSDFYHSDLNDSKQLSEKKREILRPIIEKEAISFAVSVVGVEEIDEINILNASILGMQRAVMQLKVQPEFLIIDGNRFHAMPGFKHQCIVKGDSLYRSIAAASILAKTYRDEIMCNYHLKHPHYNWKSNKGYPTQSHRKAILENGSSPLHRKSFNLLGTNQYALFD